MRVSHAQCVRLSSVYQAVSFFSVTVSSAPLHVTPHAVIG